MSEWPTNKRIFATTEIMTSPEADLPQIWPERQSSNLTTHRLSGQGSAIHQVRPSTLHSSF